MRLPKERVHMEKRTGMRSETLRHEEKRRSWQRLRRRDEQDGGGAWNRAKSADPRKVGRIHGVGSCWGRGRGAPGPSDADSDSGRHSTVSDSLQPHGLHSLWNLPGQNPGVGSLSLLPRIFPTQGSNRGLLHCRRILYQLSSQGSLRIRKCGAYGWPCNKTVVRRMTETKSDGSWKEPSQRWIGEQEQKQVSSGVIIPRAQIYRAIAGGRSAVKREILCKF